jgi:site-specific recombinase XerD
MSAMTDNSPLAPWVRRFLLEHLITERNLARNTQRSYRDTLRLLLPFIAEQAQKMIDKLSVSDLRAELIRKFLLDLEEQRNCGIATRNQRLSAIHSLAQFIGLHSPEHLEWCRQVRAIPFKKATRPAIAYLEKAEMDALLAAPDRSTIQGRRDHALLLFLYNTGARADEAAQLTISDFAFACAPQRDHSFVLIRGKGNKMRRCPLWMQTINELIPLVQGRDSNEHAFLNRCGQPLTRFGIHAMVERHAKRVSERLKSLKTKRVSPHTIRHTTATHLLRAGVDINTIRAWLGHVSINTTNIYAETDLEMKAKALAHCEIQENAASTPKHWREDVELMAFLRAL